MSGTVTDLGHVSVGAVIPAALGAWGALEGNLNGQLAAAGNLDVSFQLGPPTAEAAADVATEVVAAVDMPYFGLAIDANLDAIAAIQAQLAALAGIVASLGTAGVFLYRYDGTADSYGAAMDSAIATLPGGAPTDEVHALTLLTRTPEAWAAIQQIFKTT